MRSLPPTWVVLALAAFSTGAAALYCYDCNSNKQPACGDPFKAEGISAHPYGEEPLSAAHGPFVCVKIKGTNLTAHGHEVPDTVLRFGLPRSVFESSAREMLPPDIRLTHKSNCEKDLCNGAGPAHAHAAALALGLGLAAAAAAAAALH